MISPTTIAPTSDPTNAPTIPPQKRSGRKIVKCQMARPMITHPSSPISAHLHQGTRSPPSARPAVTARPPASDADTGGHDDPVALAAGPRRAPALLARLGLFLEHQVLGREVGGRVALGRRLRFRARHGAAAAAAA